MPQECIRTFANMFLLAANFWEKLLNWDHAVFYKVNGEWTNPVFDALMPFLRNSTHWVPLYLFLFVFMVLNFRIKGLWWAAFFLVTVALTDMTGTYVFKHGVERWRPCSDPSMVEQVRLLLKQCAGGYSFISNHAANHFGMAAFFYMTFRHISRTAALIALLWASLIAYAQVYVGVHFPLDVIGGALLGLAFGSITGLFFNKSFGITIFDNQPVA
jgi:membrane-associated phospholipid phosphatase